MRSVSDALIPRGTRQAIKDAYLARSRSSAQRMERAHEVMVRGITRGSGYHKPCVRLSLEKAGARMSDVVKILGFVTSTAYYAEYDKARGRAFDGCPPASATVAVAGLLAAARVEIEAVAFIPAN
jgi:hypothetical protein